MATKQIDNQTLELRKTLVSNIRRFRKELHLTREKFAEKAEISMSHLADIEQCRSWVSDKTLIKLAKALHKKPFELLFSTEIQEYSPAKFENQITELIFNQQENILTHVKKSFEETIQEIIALV